MTKPAYSRRCNFVHFDAVLYDEQVSIAENAR
jgi:hypothetical protein